MLGREMDEIVYSRLSCMWYGYCWDKNISWIIQCVSWDMKVEDQGKLSSL